MVSGLSTSPLERSNTSSGDDKLIVILVKSLFALFSLLNDILLYVKLLSLA